MEKHSLEERLLLSLPESTPTNETTSNISEEVEVDDNSPVTAVVIFSSCVATCRYFIVGGCSGYSSPAESGIMEDLGLSVAAYSLFGSILAVGALIGSLVNGKIADIIGRKGAMWLADIFFTIGWLAIVFSKGAWLLDLGRVSHGVGNALASYAVPIYVSEIAPKNIRGALISAIMFTFSCGFSFSYLVGIVVSWRILALICNFFFPFQSAVFAFGEYSYYLSSSVLVSVLVPCLVQVCGTFFIPESPRWLLKIGRDREVAASLQFLRGKNVDISPELANIKVKYHFSRIDISYICKAETMANIVSLFKQDYTRAFQELSEDKFIDLFKYKYAYSLTVGVVLMGLSQLGGISTVGFYASSIFERVGFSSSVGTITVAVFQIPTGLVSMLLIDKCGRRPLLLSSAAGMCLSSLLIGLSFCFQDTWRIAPVLGFVGILGFIVCYGCGMASIPSVMMSEVFPINIKSSAGTLAIFVSNLCAWIASYSFNFLMEWSSIGTFFILSGISGVTVTFIAIVVPETKGRMLEEIQASMIDHPLQQNN